MKKCLVVLLLLSFLLVLPGCNKKGETLTVEQAQQIVLEHAGVSASEAQVHRHAGDHEGKPCYVFYVTVNGKTKEYKVDMTTGEILAVTNSSHSH